jgi:hypothetical protein
MKRTSRSEAHPVDRVIAALGGRKAVADLCGVGDTALSNWKREGKFPDRLHHKIWIACANAGFSIDPAKPGTLKKAAQKAA